MEPDYFLIMLKKSVDELVRPKTALERGIEQMFDPNSEILPPKKNSRAWNLGWCTIEYRYGSPFGAEKVLRHTDDERVTLIDTLFDQVPFIQYNYVYVPSRDSFGKGEMKAVAYERPILSVERRLALIRNALMPPKKS